MARILIIDDDGIERDALAVFLLKEGHEVLTAAGGPAGLAALRASPPDLVILAPGSPTAPGPALLGEIRKFSTGMPIIALTGSNSPEAAAACLAAGATKALPRSAGLCQILAETYSLAGPPPGRSQPPPGAAGRRGLGVVLVADDDNSIVYLLTRFLADAGYCVISAADGLEAERLAHEFRPDIVLLDIAMPGKDGVKVLKSLVERMPETGVMIITGNEDEELARACLKMGAFDYAEKPLNLVAMERSIKARLLLQKSRKK